MRGFILPVFLSVGVFRVFASLMEMVMAQLGAQLPAHFLAVFEGHDQVMRRAPEVLTDALAVIGN
jgi:hypothetical protein